MSNLNDLLQLAATTNNGGLSQRKKEEVAAAGLAKQQQLADANLSNDDLYDLSLNQTKGYGLESAGQVEYDLANMMPTAFRDKYGAGADRLLARAARATARQTEDAASVARGRSTSDIITDTVGATGASFTQNVATTAALPLLAADLIGEATGVGNANLFGKTSGFISDVRENFDDTHLSSEMQTDRRLQQGERKARQRDRKFQMEQNIANGMSESDAAMIRSFNDFKDAADMITDNGMRLGDGTANAVGSLFAVKPIKSAIEYAGKKALSTLSKDTAEGLAKSKLAKIGSSTTAAIGAMEGGGGASQTAAEIGQMSDEQLEQNAPEYSQLLEQKLAQGIPEAVAREQIRNEIITYASGVSGAISGTAGILLGKLVERFEGGDLLKAAPIREFAGNVSREVIEEGGIGIVGTVGSNAAIQAYADQNKDWSEGVGEATAQGVIFAATSTGAVQGGPVALKATAVASGKLANKAVEGIKDSDFTAAAKFIGEISTDAGRIGAAGLKSIAGSVPFKKMTEATKNGLANLADKIEEKNEASSPVSQEILADAADQLQQNVEINGAALTEAVNQSTATPEAKAEAIDYVGKLQTVLTISDDDIANAPDGVREILQGANGNKITALNQLGGALLRGSKEEMNPETLKALAIEMFKLIEPIQMLQEADHDALVGLPEGSPASVAYSQYMAIVQNIASSPQALKHMIEAQSIVVAASNARDAAIAEEEIGTPIAAQKAETIVAAATLAPDATNTEAAKTLLRQAKSGQVPLSLVRQRVLAASIALTEAKAAANARAVRGGFTTKIDAVSDEVMMKKEKIGYAKSLTRHASTVLSAMKAGNSLKASLALRDLGLFAQHMSNKVASINESLVTGKKAKFEGLTNDSNRALVPMDGFQIHTGKVKSVEAAQIIALEAEAIVSVYNSLVEAFPELEATKVSPVDLDSLLLGNVNDVVNDFETGTRSVSKAEPTEAATVEEAAPVVEKVTAKEPAVKEPVAEEPQQEQEQQVAPEPAPKITKAIKDRLAKMSDAQLEALLTATMNDVIKGDTQAEARYDVIKAELDSRTPKTQTPQEQPQAEVATKPEPKPKAVTPKNTAQEELVKNTPRKISDLEEEAESLSNELDEIMVRRVEDPEAQGVLVPRDQEDADRIKEIEATLEETRFDSLFGRSTEPAKGLQGVYPNLIGSVKGDSTDNIFYKAFRFSKKATSRFAAYGDTLLSDITAIFKTPDSYNDFLGNDLQVALSEKGSIGYNQVMKIVAQLKEKMNAKLQADLMANKGDMLKQYIEGKDPARSFRGKALAITKDDGNGSLVYDDGLLEAALLAAMQVMLSGNGKSYNAEKALAKELGTDLNSVKDLALLKKLLNGTSTNFLANDIANKMVEYWGLSENKDQPMGYTKGIPTGVALEIIEMLTQEKYLERTEYTYKKKNIVRIEIDMSMLPAEAVQSPTMIERLFTLAPVLTMYFNDENVPARDTYLRTGTKITAEQKTAQKNAQSTKHYMDESMISFLEAVGLSGVELLLDGGHDTTKKYNRNHQLSLDGRKLLAADTFKYLQQMIQQTKDSTGFTALGQTPIKFPYAFTVAGRLQMGGSYNPQTNKLLREAILPTWSTLDLSGKNPAHEENLYLAIAQASGISIHTLGKEESVKQIQELLGNPLYEAIEDAIAWHESGNPDDALGVLDSIKAGLSNADLDFNTASVHAILEYARLLTLEDKSEFRTSLYIEADGVTNGVINLISLFSTGAVSTKELKNLQMGGVSYSGQASSLADLRKKDNLDFYTSVSRIMDESFNNFLHLKQAVLGGNFTQQHAAVARLAAAFMDGVEGDFNKTRKLVFKRGASKGPTTKASYGASSAGISAGIIENILGNYYAMVSRIADAQENNPEMPAWDAAFPNNPNARRIYTDIEHSMATLATRNVYWSAKHGKYFVSKAHDIRIFDAPNDLENKTLSPEALKNFESSIEFFLGNVATDAVKRQLGPVLSNNMATMATATDLQSHVYSLALVNLINETLKDKKIDPEIDFRAGDLLSEAELNKISEDLVSLLPAFTSSGMNFEILKSQVAEFVDSKIRSLSEGLRADISYRTPAKSGVKVLPIVNQGAGDAKMMLNILSALGDNAPTLAIFDGLHMPLDQVDTMGAAANLGASNAWNENPVKGMAESFNKFADTFLQSNLLTPEQMEQVFSEDDPDTYVRALSNALTKLSNDIDIRREALAGVARSTDQMAAVELPAFREGDAPIEGASTLEIAAHLNKRIKTVQDSTVVTRVSPVIEASPSSESIDIFSQSDEIDDTDFIEDAPALLIGSTPKEAVVDQAAVDKGTEIVAAVAAPKSGKSGAKTMTKTSIRNLIKHPDISEPQKQVLRQILKSFKADEWKIITGTKEEIAAYQAENGLTGEDQIDAMSGNTSGYTDPAAKRIYLYNAPIETIIHELVHASTFEAVLAYFNGSEMSFEAREAVERILSLLDQFLSSDTSKLPVDQQIAALNAIEAINAGLAKDTPEGRAEALNEFMAWGLTNSKLIETLRNTQASSFVVLARRVVQSLKKLFWGRERVESPALDALSNLQFNSAILMKEQGNLAPNLDMTSTLPMNTVFGNDERLRDIEDRMTSLLQKLFKKEALAEIKGTGKGIGNVPQSEANARFTAFSAFAQGLGFTMTPQEESAFIQVAAAFNAENAINPKFLLNAEKIYAETIKKLTPEDFKKDPEGSDLSDDQQANDKLTFLLGKSGLYDNADGSSTLIPTFLALAVTNSQLRTVLSKVELPKAEKEKGVSSLDTTLLNFGNESIASLENKLVFGNTTPKNVTDAADALVEAALASAEKANGLYALGSEVAQNAMDRANTEINNRIRYMADQLVEKTAGLKNSDKSYVRLMGAFTEAVGTLLGSQDPDVINKSLLETLSTGTRNDTYLALLTDLFGRNSSNASVYDMIKLVKTEAQQTRQNYRVEVPKIIEGKFVKQPTPREWTAITNAMSKTDLAALVGSLSFDQISALMQSDTKLNQSIKDTEDAIAAIAPDYASDFIAEAKKLAKYLSTGQVQANMLRNSTAISNLLGRARSDKKKWVSSTAERNRLIDELVTLYALEQVSEADKVEVRQLLTNEKEGMSFLFSYLQGNRATDMDKMKGNSVAAYNHYKGYTLPLFQEGVDLVVVDDSEHSKMISKSYQRVGAYTGSNLRKGQSKSYYFAPVGGRGNFNQGIFQNVKETVGGVDVRNGLTHGLTAGFISDPYEVSRITKLISKETQTTEPLMPVFGVNGEIVGYEQAVDPAKMASMQPEQNLAKVLGAMRGRQIEESKAASFNQLLIDNLGDMYDQAVKDNGQEAADKDFINIMDPANLNDPVYGYSVKLLSLRTRMAAEGRFGAPDRLMVRKDMLKDVVGYPAASITDAWSGVSRWSKPVQDAVKTVLISTFGNDAYKRVLQFERITQGLVSDAKLIIAVKSGIVPLMNMASNVLQLWGRGVPLDVIMKSSGVKVAELNSYQRRQARQIEIESELFANKDRLNRNKLEAELQAIQDTNKRMSIWPLIEAGEFSAISDIGLTHNEYELTDGKFGSYVDGLVEKLPGSAQTFGRYALITKDTALYQFLQKSVQYGDFVAKAIRYDHLMERQGKTSAEALGVISDAFVNYDVLPGRTRGTLESFGLLWFWNFKLRIAKEAALMIKENPAQALLFAGLSGFGPISSPGSPLTDSVFAKALDGGLEYSIGPGMGFSAPSLNPWHNLVD